MQASESSLCVAKMRYTTGNGWAAAGMLRVLGTIQHSQYSSNMQEQAKNLTNWVSEIHTGIYPHLVCYFTSHPHASRVDVGLYSAQTACLETTRTTAHRSTMLPARRSSPAPSTASRSSLASTRTFPMPRNAARHFPHPPPTPPVPPPPRPPRRPPPALRLALARWSTSHPTCGSRPS